MNKSASRALFALFLGFFVAVGTSLSVVQANEMAVKMAVSIDMDGDGHGDCGGCLGGNDGNGAGCEAACAFSASALIPAVSSVKSTPFLDLFPFAPSAIRDGPTSIEPYPPKF